MKDIDIRNIQPVVERRTPEKPGSVQKPANDKFQQDLDKALTANSTASSTIEAKADRLVKEVIQNDQQIKAMRDTHQRMLVEMQIRKAHTEK